ncbi:hypothetical protein B0H16DRAFT_147542 [Mycena metata]|uniref:Uncharacterized protein n=1 Tax=Mycena metata TaxID=1033252 RepID=A0AAD7NSK3_9AGAR|nr:hypothetical protein B0H16DRAFT_147542 [Mycena metata]
MSASEDLSDEICPGCNTYRLTRPIKCTGYYNSRNKDRWYQKCSSNDFTVNAECKKFIFNDEVQRAYETGAFDNGRSSPATAPPLVRVPSSSPPFSPSSRRPTTPCANSCTRHVSRLFAKLVAELLRRVAQPQITTLLTSYLSTPLPWALRALGQYFPCQPLAVLPPAALLWPVFFPTGKLRSLAMSHPPRHLSGPLKPTLIPLTLPTGSN